jgi:Holliday junction resolvase
MATAYKENRFWWEDRLWKRKMDILDASLAHPDAPRNFINPKPYSQAYITGLIGEREARKWLEQKGFEVFDYEGLKGHFEMIDYNASRILKTLAIMRRRRKQEYIEQDKKLILSCKLNIIKQVHFLKELFGNNYYPARRLFIEIHRLREKLCHSNRKRGSSQPDLIVKKGKEVSFVEVKANTSDLSVVQRGCFKLAKIYGFNALTLKVKVESNVAKDIRLLYYNGRIGSIEKPQMDLKICQYEAIIEAFNALGGAKTAYEIKEWVTNKYGSVWKDFSTPMCKMLPSHLNRHCPKKYRVLTRQCRGIYVVAGTVPKE